MIAPFVAILAAAAVATSPIGLMWPKPMAKDLASLPRIASPATAETAKVNAALKRGDGRSRAAARDCRASAKEGMNKDGGDWSQSVSAPFRYGPWLSVVASDDWYCGGPYPDTDTLALTYDLEQGRPLDWRTLLPKAAAGEASTDAGGDGTVKGLLTSAVLSGLYKRGVLAGMDKDLRKDCADLFDQPLPLMLWLDAEREAVVMQTTAFPHVAKACAEEVTLTPAELTRIGAAPRLIALLKAAHAAHAWTDGAHPR